MQIFDPRSIATPVYKSLTELFNSSQGNSKQLKEQKAQAFALYSYLSTWGMMRLKAEEAAITGGKKVMVEAYFNCLEKLSSTEKLAGSAGLHTITNLETEAYLGLTGLGLALAQEFSFWVTAIYVDVNIDGDE